jgi:hypothetical protein
MYPPFPADYFRGRIFDSLPQSGFKLDRESVDSTKMTNAALSTIEHKTPPQAAIRFNTFATVASMTLLLLL